MEIFTQIRDKISYRVSDDSLALIEKACGILETEPQSINGASHSLNLLSYFDELISQNPDLASKFNQEVILVAIFWHDIWKVQNQPKGFWGSALGVFLEGIYASRLFVSKAQEAGFDEKLTKQIAYVIRKHAAFECNRLTPESRIFHDIDQKDSENPERKAKLDQNLASKPLMRLLYMAQSLMLKKYYFKEILNIKI